MKLEYVNNEKHMIDEWKSSFYVDDALEKDAGKWCGVDGITTYKGRGVEPSQRLSEVERT